jgi:predicted RNase H-like HicB family nuclease
MTVALQVEKAEEFTNREVEPRPLRLEPLREMPELDERVYQAIADVESLTQLPVQLIEKYAEIAIRHATLKRYPDGWIASIPRFQGVWAEGPSQEQALDLLREVVLDWTLLKVEHRDGDLPVLEEIDLNVL